MREWEALKNAQDGIAVHLEGHAPRRVQKTAAHGINGQLQWRTINGTWKAVDAFNWAACFANQSDSWSIFEPNPWQDVKPRNVIARMEDEPGLEWEVSRPHSPFVWLADGTIQHECGNQYQCRRRDPA